MQPSKIRAPAALDALTGTRRVDKRGLVHRGNTEISRIADLRHLYVGIIGYNDLQSFVGSSFRRAFVKLVENSSSFSNQNSIFTVHSSNFATLNRLNEDAPVKSAVVRRSVVIGGHKTSISLEDAFWDHLRGIARARQCTLSKLIAEIDASRQHSNLSSAIRLFVLEYFRAGATRESQPSSVP